MHLQNPKSANGFQAKLESGYAKPSRDQLRILSKLNSRRGLRDLPADQVRRPERFSLEGGESLIPLLDAIISDAADEQLNEVAIGMALAAA
ncbi:hypothetical protein [Glutamicibacter nicotianae]|uniref:hypothetical protein n=1 Tax=Glutamicibacter nicotianae TaxID=37929 RepID=UPI001CBE9A28|nr:hypothetical protein [Glutamicibacter nicotianae]